MTFFVTGSTEGVEITRFPAGHLDLSDDAFSVGAGDAKSVGFGVGAGVRKSVSAYFGTVSDKMKITSIM